uniref:Uncharacterized protein n=1 Tax=Tetranychus urticae TaxID=32264 RepID=T1KH19_TETUR
MLCHCTSIVWSAPLPRTEPSILSVISYSIGRYMFDDFHNASPFRQFLINSYFRLTVPINLLRMTPLVQVVEEVLEKNRPKLNAVKFIGQRFRKFLKNIKENYS